MRTKTGTIKKMKGNPTSTDPRWQSILAIQITPCLSLMHVKIHSIVAIGGNLKLLNQSIFEFSGNGFGIDIGLILTPFTSFIKDGKRGHDFKIGTMLLDATGTQIRWNTADKPIFTRPRRLRFGGAYQFTYPSFGQGSISVDLETGQSDLEEGTDSGSGIILRTGAEYWLFDILALRFGWNGHGVSAGTGLQLRVSTMTFFVDYAFNTHTLGGSQRISVSGQF